MLQKTKSFFSFLFRKKISFLSLVFVFFNLLFLPLPASAGIWETLKNLPLTIPSAAIAAIVWILGMLASLLLTFSNTVLMWVLSDSFTQLPYTKPGPLPDGNPIIEVGLSVTQGLVNMLLVLILVYIALATILRLAGHETKKLLVTFIVVALLVNFAPVICGLVVDASNIVMNFFIKGIGQTGGSTLINRLSNVSKIFTAGFLDSMGDFRLMAEKIMRLSLVTIANLLLAFAFLLFAFLFACRYIVIWILVILSPLAFACYILPATKKYFDMWWKQFINWSFIGVTCSFFLYLGMRLANLPLGTFGTPTGIGTIVLPYMTPIVFLFIGLIFGLQTSAAGASSIISVAKRGGRASVKWTGGKIAQRGIRPVLEKMRMKEAVGKISKGIEKVPVARWFLPEAARKYGQMRPAIEKGQERAKAYSSQTLGHRLLTGADTQTDAAGLLKEMIERGDEEDIYKEAKKLKKWKGKSDEEILADKDFQRILSRPLQIGASGGILNSRFLRAAPRLARVAWEKKIGSYANRDKEKGGFETADDAVAEATRQARRPNINQMERETFEDEIVVGTMMEKGREIPEAVVSQVKKGQETMLNTVDDLFSDYIRDVLSKTNATLANMTKKGDPKNTEVAWDEYRKYFKGKHQDKDGYFQYVEGQRAKEMGWRKGQYRTSDQKEKGLKPTTPFEAGMGPEPSLPDTGKTRARKTESESPLDTGKARKTKRKEPDTGKK